MKTSLTLLLLLSAEDPGDAAASRRGPAGECNERSAPGTSARREVWPLFGLFAAALVQ